MATNLPADQRQKFKQMMTKDLDIAALNKAMTDAMVKPFTTERLKALADFYCSPVAVFPANKLCRHITEKHVKDEVYQIIYSNREKQMVREKRFAHFADSQRLRLIKKRYACGNQADDEKRHEIIADEKNQH